MFRNIFSFDGRIRRTEYGITTIIYWVIYLFIKLGSDGTDGVKLLGLLFVPLLWFFWAQGAKRCHDLGNSGWWQIIPFYVLWLIFQKGMEGENYYGDDPKGPVIPLEYVDPYPLPGTNYSTQATTEKSEIKDDEQTDNSIQKPD